MPKTPKDPIHPEYYDIGGISAIEYIEAKQLGYHLGQVIKYVSRAGHKPGVERIQDLKKALFYLSREIEIL